MPQLLLEILSEEIPARMQGGAGRDLERLCAERLKAAGLTWETMTAYAGPRRLTLVVEGLPEATPDREEEIKGPKASAAEQALEGFLRKTGLTREQLVERDGVLFAIQSSKGRQTTEVIAETVDQVIRAFPWPKSMRWGDGTLRWVRPIKRILCLFDGEVVPFTIADGSPDIGGRAQGIESGDATEGHRFLGTGRSLKVRDFADYRRQLEANFVLIDAADRRLRILEGARAVCHERGLALVDDDGLLDEVAGLAEWPTPILGDMDPAFLDLPPEVIRLSMKVHQKYFAVRDPARGGLAPHFVVVANVEASDGGKALAAGNARVLSARLNDARFFWDEDRKAGAFEAWLKKLEGVTFHARLGTMAERVERIAALAREIAPLVGADPEAAELAGRLCKADLASGMVGEFPELQGVMGGYYLREAAHSPTRAPLRSAVPPQNGEGDEGADGLPPLHGGGQGPQGPGWGNAEAIADAVRDHYRPQGPNDTVPTAPLTVAVALADKLDTLVGFFAIDEKPTGSKDPFALRRAALGVIRLVLTEGYRLNLAPLIFDRAQRLQRAFTDKARDALIDQQLALEGQVSDEVLADITNAVSLDRLSEDAPWRLRTEPYQVSSDLLAFFADRLKVLLRDQGRRHDLVDAVFALGDDDLVRIVRRVEALSDFLTTEDGTNLLAGYRRASNILKAEEKKGPRPEGEAARLADAPAEEGALIAAVETASGEVEAALASEDFAGAMIALARLRQPVDAFFEAVLVNSEIAAERENRLKLLGQVRGVMGRVADFGQVAG